MGRYRGVPTVSKEFNRITWLEKYPEDIPLDAENQEARKRYIDENVRALLAAVCLRSILDYQMGKKGKTYDPLKRKPTPRAIVTECKNFFQTEIFSFFTNGMELNDIERYVSKVPYRKIRSYVSNLEKERLKSQKIQGLL